MADPRLGPASHPRPEKLSVMMPSAKMGSMGTLLSSQSMFMFTSSMAPPVPPTAMVTMLLASWIRRRVFRSWKKWFQSSFELVVVESDAELDADAVLALRRAANWHWRGVDVGFRGVFWKEILVEICLDVTRTAHGCRASDMKDDDECGRCAPREKAVRRVVWSGSWSWSPRLLPRVTRRAAAAAVVGVNIVSFVVPVQLEDRRMQFRCVAAAEWIDGGVESFSFLLSRRACRKLDVVCFGKLSWVGLSGKSLIDKFGGALLS